MPRLYSVSSEQKMAMEGSIDLELRYIVLQLSAVFREQVSMFT